MIRIHIAAAAAVLCSVIQVGCDSGTSQPFKGKRDGATNSGGSDSGSDGAGGSSAGAGGASSGGNSGDSGVPPASCGAVFGHAGACNTCLEANCCDLGIA